MQIHKKITIINIFLIFIFVVLFIYFFNIEISLNNLLKFLLFIFLFFIMSNFFTKFSLVNTYKKAEFDFVRLSEINFNIDENIVRDVLNVLIDEEKIVKINDEMFTLKSLMDKAEIVVREKLEKNNLITISELRDALNTSRKSAKPMLEYFDNMKITRKNGAESERVAY